MHLNYPRSVFRYISYNTIHIYFTVIIFDKTGIIFIAFAIIDNGNHKRERKYWIHTDFMPIIFFPRSLSQQYPHISHNEGNCWISNVRFSITIILSHYSHFRRSSLIIWITIFNISTVENEYLYYKSVINMAL